MKYRKGIFFVVYRKEKGKVKYLVLNRKLHWKGWEFPKAGVEREETGEKAVVRELREETGCKAEKITKFNISGKYKYTKEIAERKGYIGQSWKLFAVEVDCGKIKIDRREHKGYKWLNVKDAVKILTWNNQKKCLRIVNKNLS